MPQLPGGTVLSVYNYKGGVGKTTLLANLATAAAMDGKKVLLVDCDPQCNLSDLLHPAGHKLPMTDESDAEEEPVDNQKAPSQLAAKLFTAVSTWSFSLA